MTRSPSSQGSPPERSHRAGGPARGTTLVITNLTKLGGLVIVLNETLIRPELRPEALAVASLMMLGAQVAEDMILKAIDRFFDRG